MKNLKIMLPVLFAILLFLFSYFYFSTPVSQEQIDAQDKKIEEQIDAMRQNLALIEEQKKKLSLEMDSQKNMFSKRYEERKNKACQQKSPECEKMQKNTTLSDYSIPLVQVAPVAHAQAIVLDEAKLNEEIEERKIEENKSCDRYNGIDEQKKCFDIKYKNAPRNTSDISRIDSFLRGRATALRDYGHVFISLSQEYNVDADFAVAVCWAETRCGKSLSTANNYFNVGNNDRGVRISNATVESGIRSFFRLIAEGKYQKGNYMIGHYSNGGRRSMGIAGCGDCFATSQENWNKNVKNIMSEIKGQDIGEDYIVRGNI